MNDIQKNGLKDDSKTDVKRSPSDIQKHKSNNVQPTPVTLMNIRAGTKDRTGMHEGIWVLLDTGCPHSIISKKYSSKNKRKNKN